MFHADMCMFACLNWNSKSVNYDIITKFISRFIYYRYIIQIKFSFEKNKKYYYQLCIHVSRISWKRSNRRQKRFFNCNQPTLQKNHEILVKIKSQLLCYNFSKKLLCHCSTIVYSSCQKSFHVYVSFGWTQLKYGNAEVIRWASKRSSECCHIQYLNSIRKRLCCHTYYDHKPFLQMQGLMKPREY